MWNFYFYQIFYDILDYLLVSYPILNLSKAKFHRHVSMLITPLLAARINVWNEISLKTILLTVYE